MPEDWMSLTEAARMLGYSDSATLRQAAKDGKLKVERLRSGEHIASYMTKESWVRAWDTAREAHRDKGWERGKKRGPRRRPSPQEKEQL